MTVIYLTKDITRCYGVTFQSNGSIKVQKFEDKSNIEKNVLYIRPLETFLSKSEVYNMT